ncbi:MAG: hypothetical protein Ct9H300mP28_24360 [Pseudomonadota bacterium]|nr:MAG: hypothetical protein Ct9H300mP28_24360 [Pseudomonadota bacterium]
MRGNFKRAMSGLIKSVLQYFRMIRNLAAPRNRAFRRGKMPYKASGIAQQLESNCRKNGIQVYWAETVDQANQLVLEIARAIMPKA